MKTTVSVWRREYITEITIRALSERLHLYRIRVVGVLIDLPERLEVGDQRLRSLVRCPFCRFKANRVHETRRVRLKDCQVVHSVLSPRSPPCYWTLS